MPADGDRLVAIIRAQLEADEAIDDDAGLLVLALKASREPGRRT